MKDVYEFKERRNAQTLVFFLLAWGTIMLLCGLAIDSGLLYLAKARMGRAVDGAALAAVGNFNRNSASPAANRDAVALIMRNFAVANFTSLEPISTVGGPTGGTASSYLLPNGTTGVSYTYSFNDTTQDPNGAFRRFVDVTLNTGSGGAITGATCNARCPVQTYFIGYATYAINGRQNVKIGGYSGPSGLADLKVSSSAVATRNPRLIMVVIDRSASMLAPHGGATGLAPAVVQFLDFFDTSSDTIGIVSFGSSARLEMAPTTNFIYAGTNNLIDGYETNIDVPGQNNPGVDPESVVGNAAYQHFYTTTGIRRLKFGGDTAADDGIRLGLEEMMANAGFTDPDVVKYMVIFTDGAWNATRTLLAAPGYTNIIMAPNYPVTGTNLYVTALNLTNGAVGAWSTNPTNDTQILAVPSLGQNPTNSNNPWVIGAIEQPDEISGPGAVDDFIQLAPYHTNDVWQSIDQSGWEPLNTSATQNAGVATIGSSMTVTNTTWIGTTMGTNYYTHNLDVWLQPGSVAYVYPTLTTTSPTEAYVSNFNQPNQHINVTLLAGQRLELDVPGYIVDGEFFDGLDLCAPDNALQGISTTYPRYREDNYQQGFMWPDDSNTPDYTGSLPPYYSTSLMRQLMFRNYPNLLTGFYVFKGDEEQAPYISSRPAGQQGIEPIIADSTNSVGAVGGPRALNGLGCYYPSAGFYWPFGGLTDVNGYVTNAVGVDYHDTYALPNPNSDPDPDFSQGYQGGSRHIAYSLNMLSTNAAPEWYGELFYNSINGGGTNSFSGTSDTSVSHVMQSGSWQANMPGFMVPLSTTGVMMDEATHNTTIVGSPSVWRPASFNGSNFPTSYAAILGKTAISATGGFVTDGVGNYFANTMAWSGRPTHYYDFSKSSWEPIQNNHVSNQQALQLGNWKAGEYAWHARALGVTIYTVGYGSVVSPTQCAALAQIANATNVIEPLVEGSSTIVTNDNTYNSGQPIGQQFYATTAAQISNDFYSIGQAINAALTQ
jgi:hypothetical protein